MEEAFRTKTQEVMAGRHVLATSDGFLHNQVYWTKAPGEDSLKRTAFNGVMGAFFGAFFGCAEIAWSSPDTAIKGAKSWNAMIRRAATPAVWCSLIATTYTLAESTMETNRNTKDPWNAVVGGMAAGFIIGFSTGRFDYSTATAIGTGLTMGIVDLLGPAMVYNASKGIPQDYSVRPPKYVECDELIAMKEKYPKYKDL